MKIAIIGAGEVGFHIASKLCDEKQDVVVIDVDAERLRHLEEELDAQFILGSGSSPDTLKQAGIAQAGMVIAVSDQDEVNIVACMLARHYAPEALRIARVRNLAYMENPRALEELHFDLFINPEHEAAQRLLRLMDVPQALDLIPFSKGKVLLAGFRIQPESPAANRKLFTLREISGYNPLAAAIYRGSEVIVPRGADTLCVGDLVYFAVAPEEIPRLLRMMGLRAMPAQRVMIFGGSDAALDLALQLESRGMEVKLIEEDEERCTFLADRLAHTTVLHGEGVDRELMLQENVSYMDVFLAASKDDEENILAALLAKSLGAKAAFVLVNRMDYLNLVPAIGIDAAISPQFAAVSRIMQFLRKGQVVAVEAIRHLGAEGIEFLAQEESEAVRAQLKDIRFPEGALVIAIVRGEQVIIPSGESVIMPDDRVVIFARRDAIPKVEKLFAVKLKYY